LRPRSLSASHRSMLPWALDRTRSADAAARFAPPRPFGAGRFASRFQPLRRPRPEKSRKARSLGLVWLLRRCLPRPEGLWLAARSLPTRRSVRAAPLAPLRREERVPSRSAPMHSRRKHLGLIPHQA
jgi:hypothetical protein